MDHIEVNICPLCLARGARLYYLREFDRVKFFECLTCRLVFKDVSWALSLGEQRLRYLKHQNEESPDYVEFLSLLWRPLKQYLKQGDLGLDFGCGPTKVFQAMAARHHFWCESYDPIFWPEETLLQDKYDFIFCSEVVEHFVDVQRDWKLLKSVVGADAIIGVMTRFVPDDFATWFYHLDPTHVSFYTPTTFRWIANNFGFHIEEVGNNIVIFRGGQG